MSKELRLLILIQVNIRIFNSESFKKYELIKNKLFVKFVINDRK